MPDLGEARHHPGPEDEAECLEEGEERDVGGPLRKQRGGSNIESSIYKIISEEQ